MHKSLFLREDQDMNITYKYKEFSDKIETNLKYLGLNFNRSAL